MSYYLYLYNTNTTQTTVPINICGQRSNAYIAGLARKQQIDQCNLIIYNSLINQEALMNYAHEVFNRFPEMPIILATGQNNNTEPYFACCPKVETSVEEILEFSADLLFGKENAVTIV